MRFLTLTVSQMYCSLQPLHCITEITCFDLHDISSFTLNIFPLKLAEDPSVMYLHRPHRGSLHFETL